MGLGNAQLGTSNRNTWQQEDKRGKRRVQVLEEDEKEEDTLPTTSILPDQQDWRTPANCRAANEPGLLGMADIQGSLSLRPTLLHLANDSNTAILMEP
ncbi:hypothetical protein BTVI_103855 [Pitangus sulphuratus]|nr:hypothetical protein BTVI_103855 [Pitangus sulphuratus]